MSDVDIESVETQETTQDPNLADQVAQAATDAATKAVSAAFEAERIKAQEAEAAAANQPMYNPASEAVQVVRTQEALVRDALKEYPDAPESVKDALRDKLAEFDTSDALKAVKARGIHETIANDIILKEAKKGSYTPGVFKQAPSVRVEPVHSEPVYELPKEAKDESDRLSKELGVEISQDAIQAEMAHMQRMGYAR